AAGCRGGGWRAHRRRRAGGRAPGAGGILAGGGSRRGTDGGRGRRSGDEEVAAGRATERGSCGRAPHVARVRRVAVSPEHAVLPSGRHAAAGPRLARRRVYGRASRRARTRARLGRDKASRRRAARGADTELASAQALPATPPLARPATAEGPRNARRGALRLGASAAPRDRGRG